MVGRTVMKAFAKHYFPNLSVSGYPLYLECEIRGIGNELFFTVSYTAESTSRSECLKMPEKLS